MFVNNPSCSLKPPRQSYAILDSSNLFGRSCDLTPAKSQVLLFRVVNYSKECYGRVAQLAEQLTLNRGYPPSIFPMSLIN